MPRFSLKKSYTLFGKWGKIYYICLQIDAKTLAKVNLFGVLNLALPLQAGVKGGGKLLVHRQLRCYIDKIFANMRTRDLSSYTQWTHNKLRSRFLFRGVRVEALEDVYGQTNNFYKQLITNNY